MDLQHQISQLADDYRAWLSSRPHRNSQTPAALKQRILDLSPHFPRDDFAKRIGMNPGTLSLWQNQQGHRTPETQSDPFVLINEPAEALDLTPIHQSRSQLTLTNASGASLSWTGDISPEQLAVLVEVLR